MATPIMCGKCGKDAYPVAINGRCMNCNPFNACKVCGEGDLKSKPTPSWQNRWVCDKCGIEVSK